MHFRLPIGRIILGLGLALSLAIGGVAAIAATAASNPSIAGEATLSTIHTNGMRHGPDSSGDALAQVLCLFACMGLTAAPSLPAPDVVIAHPFFGVQSRIAGRDAGDQVLTRPSSPPPRAVA